MTNSNEKGPSPEEAHSAKAATNSHETDTELSSNSSDNQSEQIDPPTETSKIDPDQSICSETEEQPDENTPEEEIAGLKDKLLRALADMENLRRRSQKDLEEARKYSTMNFARDILSVADNFRRAIESVPEIDNDSVDGFVEGISLTEKELFSTLERHGIKRIEPLEEKFDPQFHEAMYEIPTEDAENGTVMQVVEVGYVIHDRLLRPAKVGIAKSAISNATETPDENNTTDGSE